MNHPCEIKPRAFFRMGAIMLIGMMSFISLLYSQTIRKGPYLIYRGDNTSMQVLWQTDMTSSDTINWGTDRTYGMGSAVSDPYESDYQHAYIITGLTPGAKYYYRVKIGSATYDGSFYAAPDGSQTHVRFLAYGDTRTNTSIHNQAADSILTAATNDESYHTFVLSVGDLVYHGDQESYWTNEFFNRSYTYIQDMVANLPFQACIGNHEETGTLFQKYFPYPDVAGRYWSFNYGPVHFAVVDQYTSYIPGSAQYQWLENDLASSTKPWKIIYLHEPGWSAYGTGGHANNTSVQQYIEPLCEKYNVPLVIAGHNHYYARARVVGTTGKVVQHVTTGGGGAPLDVPNLSQPNIVTATSAYHYCKVDVQSDTTLTFTAISIADSVIDQFTITQILTTVTLTTDVNPSVYGQQVLLTAALSGGESLFTGTVTLKEGSATIGTSPVNSSGIATFPISSLTSGVHPLTAMYSGDVNHLVGASSMLSQTVNKAATSAAIASSLNPSVYGDTVCLTATVTVTAPAAGLPTGSVTFTDSGQELGTVALNTSRQAVFATASLAAGIHSIVAHYGGDGNFDTSSSSVFSDTVLVPLPSTIHAFAGPHGSIYPAGDIVVAPGDTQYFSITPEPNYWVDSILVDGIFAGSDTNYTFRHVSRDHTISATFRENYVVRRDVVRGWNLLSLPVGVRDGRKATLFPTATSGAFAYEGTYTVCDTLVNGAGYWVQFPYPQSIAIGGKISNYDSAYVHAGWNLIGSITVPIPVASIGSDPPGLQTSAFFGYSGSYGTVDSILPGKAYWTKVNLPGKLILSSAPAGNAAARVEALATADGPPLPPTGIEETTGEALPGEYALDQAYPNPFNPTTVLTYRLPAASRVSIKVYNLLGQMVGTLKDEIENAGYKQILWNASSFGSGVYFCRIEAAPLVEPTKTFTSVKKLVLMK